MLPFNPDPGKQADAQAPKPLKDVLADLPPIELEQLKQDVEYTRETIDDALYGLLLRVRPSVVRAFLDEHRALCEPLLARTLADDPLPQTLSVLRIRAGQSQAHDEPLDAMRSAVNAIREHYRVNFGREPDSRDMRSLLGDVLDDAPRRPGPIRRRRRRGHA